ncbi:Copia protein [Ooceraea biroi]|uniref:Copia protein n=1 Tax=Ooceraea biroi TaxID=2015173 RepID=A0A026W6C6_OOCBI|nr:Copia protein [Ooceraea biroi]
MGDSFDLRNITKFNGTKFQLWKFQMLAVFETCGCKEIVKGSLVRPAEDDPIHTNWVSKNAKAKCILASSMEFAQLEYLISCQTANEMWQKLSNIYEQRSAANKSILLSRFYECRMGANETVMQHVSKIENLARQLNDVGEALSDIAINTKILMTLPERFNPLVTAWDSVLVENQTRANLIERVIKEEQRLTVTDAKAEALVTTSTGKRGDKFKISKKFDSTSTRKSKNKKDIERYFCHKLGHYAKDCFKKKDLNRDKSDIACQSLTSSKSKFSRDEHGAFLVTEIENSVLNADIKNSWLLDSGASRHMSFQRNWFSDFVEISESVCLGDNSVCEVKGRGIIYFIYNINTIYIVFIL